MRITLAAGWAIVSGLAKRLSAGLTLMLFAATSLLAAQEEGGGEANLQLPDLSSVAFLGMDGHKLLALWHRHLHPRPCCSA